MNLNVQYDDVNDAYFELQYIKKHYVQREETRNGSAFVFRGPVLVTNVLPYRRVLFDPVRNANPFFHYMEAIWMLAGGENIEFPAKFAQNIKRYSDDGKTLWGAYGHRWRFQYDVDQLAEVILRLEADPNTRRAVLAMWDPAYDCTYNGKDLPCNTHIYFRNQDNRLDMTVCNRSNDLVWGMLGSNFVTFAVLQEYVASAIGMTPGSLHQFTNNLHVYEGWEDKFFSHPDPWYREQGTLPRIPFSPESLDWREAETFVEYGEVDQDLKSSILIQNAFPMLQSWEAHKDGDAPLAMHYASKIYDGDWAKACIEWLERASVRAADREA